MLHVMMRSPHRGRIALIVILAIVTGGLLLALLGG